MDWTPTITDRQGPLFQRIVSVMVDDIASGRLRQGQALPTHRALAHSLGVDLTTVTRAYGEAKRLGLIEAHVGRGTFVRGATPHERAARLPGIDLSMNLPPQPRAADLSGHLVRALAEIETGGGLAPYLAYQNAGGTLGERHIAARWIEQMLPGTPASRLLVFPGNQTAILCLLLALAKPGDTVFAETLTYPGLKLAAAATGVRLLGIEIDAEGLKPQALDRACATHAARLLFLTPTMHNPTTATMSPRRRAEIARIISRRALTLIEDDPYVPLLPGTVPLTHLVPKQSYFATSLSKCMAPGLRISFLVAPSEAEAMRMAGLLRAAGQMSTPLMTAIATRWMSDGRADAIVAAVRAESSARQALAREVLAGHVFFAHPDGLHIWLPLSHPWSAAAFADAVRNRGLAVVTGETFATGPPAPNAVRVALGAATGRPQLRRALSILKEALDTPPGTRDVV